MLPEAKVSHHSSKRLRIRIPSRKGDWNYFKRIGDSLVKYQDFDVLQLNPVTGSVLFIDERLDVDGLEAYAEDHRLFDLKREGLGTVPLSRRIAEPLSGADTFLSRTTGGFLDLPGAAFLLLLGAAAGISLLTGGILDAVVIAGVVVANAMIGYGTESAAERTIHSLKHMVHPTAEVLREGRVLEIPAEDLVPGDVLFLKPGTYVSADGRLLEASHLSIDESVLTGESMPVFKSPGTLKGKNIPLPDRLNMVFMGTLVTGGEGVAVVAATGRFTEMGRLQVLLGETEAPETSFERQLRVVGDQLVLLCGVICGVVFLIGFLRGHGFLQMLRVSISLAASAVPEGLPAAATINFSLGIKRMRKDHVLVRRLKAIETLGSVQTVPGQDRHPDPQPDVRPGALRRE